MTLDLSITSFLHKYEVMSTNPGAWKVEELERTIRDLSGLAAELENNIKYEESRTKVADTSHPSYSSYAASASERLTRLRVSIVRFEAELKAARQELEAADKT